MRKLKIILNNFSKNIKAKIKCSIKNLKEFLNILFANELKFYGVVGKLNQLI